jgi:hydroxymethylbilane synthase
VAGHARLEGAQRETMHLRALVGRTDGSELLQGVRDGRPGQAEEIGADLAEELLAKGARAILAELSA